MRRSICFENEIEIINKAKDVLKDRYAFHNSTLRTQFSSFEGLDEINYKELDYKLKAIRQDFSKILIIMNRIDMNYKSYQNDKSDYLYYSIMNDQATSELGCLIEYLFAKYRVILEYIHQILEICIPPRFDDKEKNKYDQLKKYYKKHNFLISFIAKNVDENNNLLNMDWFQQLRIERDLIIHDGATCLVFGDKEKLIFQVMTTDAMDKDDVEIHDSFFCDERGIVDYNRYWGLHISKLIVFAEIVFEYLNSESKMTESNEYIMNHVCSGKDGLMDSDGNVLPDVQSVLENMLSSISEMD